MHDVLRDVRREHRHLGHLMTPRQRVVAVQHDAAVAAGCGLDDLDDVRRNQRAVVPAVSGLTATLAAFFPALLGPLERRVTRRRLR